MSEKKRKRRAKLGAQTFKVTPSTWVKPDDLFVVVGGRCYLFRNGALVGDRPAAPVMEFKP